VVEDSGPSNYHLDGVAGVAGIIPVVPIPVGCRIRLQRLDPEGTPGDSSRAAAMNRFFRQGRPDAQIARLPRDRRALHRGRPTAAVESLEQRVMLSADTAGLTRQIDWNGRAVEVHADAWIARTSATNATDLGLAAGWRAESLGEGFFVLTTPGAGLADVTGWAAGSPLVASVEPDFVIAPAAIPNDPSFGSLWGLHNTGQSGGLVDADIDAPAAWETTTGSRSVVIAVIDTGVDYGHRDLAANAWRNPGEIAGDGLDNDGNGFVDDVYGWDFANRDADPMDDNGHGTHVAGTIGAVGGNGTGVVGVNWQVSIMALKFLTGSGSGSTSGAIGAINYATRMKRDFGVNVVATNNSWGGGGVSSSLRDAIAGGGRAGILFVAAAGNDGTNNDVTPHYPSNYVDDAVISVAAIDRSNRLASFSNFGATSVDVAAPGASITSTLPGNRYGSYSGTSMATPHVAGVVGLLAAANPAATAAEIRTAILSTTTPVAALAGRMTTGGLVNAAAAVAAILPTAPVDPGTPPTEPPVTEPPVTEPPVTEPPVTEPPVTEPPVTEPPVTEPPVTEPPVTEPPVTEPPVTEPPAPPTVIQDVGQVIASATVVPSGAGAVRLEGIIGDGRFGRRDVDMYRVRLEAGQTLVIDVDARSLPEESTLDSFVRVFDSRGILRRFNDDFGGSRDSRLVIRPQKAGVFYVGVSGYRNSTYDARTGRGARDGSTGTYQLGLIFGEVPARRRAADTIRMLGFADAGPSPQPQSSQSAFAAIGAKRARR
jgi:subtilisin family serine protease